MNAAPQSNAQSPSNASSESQKAAPKPETSEFKITVRKLEIPVRPRGVLAE
jgi:hypothetical protein